MIRRFEDSKIQRMLVRSTWNACTEYMERLYGVHGMLVWSTWKRSLTDASQLKPSLMHFSASR